MLDQDSKDLLTFMMSVSIRFLAILFGLIFVFSLLAAWHDRNWPVPKVYRIELIQKQGGQLDHEQLDRLAETISKTIILDKTEAE